MNKWFRYTRKKERNIILRFGLVTLAGLIFLAFSMASRAEEEENDQTSNQKQEKIVEPSSQDVTFKVDYSPEGKYGEAITLNFNAAGNSCNILSVTPHIDMDFPFETSGDAYKTTSCEGLGTMACSYSFIVRKNIDTGYHMIPFYVKYTKEGHTFETELSVSVYLTGKPEKKEEENHLSSTPRLMITDFSIDKEALHPNEEFDLEVTIKNTAKESVKNILISAFSEDNSFYPVNTTGNIFVDSLKGGEEMTANFHLKSVVGLEANAYNISIKAEYENAKSEGYEAIQNIPLMIKLEQSVMIGDVYTDLYEASVGDTVEVTATIYNTGAAPLYKVCAKVEGDNLDNADTYVAKLEAGGKANIDILTRAIDITADGKKDNKLIITYEDEDGNVFDKDCKLSITVAPAKFDNLEKVKEDTTASFRINWYAVCGVIAIAIIAMFIVIKNRKKKEWMDKF